MLLINRSNSSKIIFPENTSHALENIIQPLVLDYSLDNEVALANILYPKYYYLFMSDNDDFFIKVVNVCDVGISPPFLQLEAMESAPSFIILGQVANKQVLINKLNEELAIQ